MSLYRRLILWLGKTRSMLRLTTSVIVPVDRFLYRRTGGRLSLSHIGGRRAALQTLLLTTTGRKSGQQRTATVLYLEDDGRLMVVASNFGQERHPAWSANLLADPQASVLIRRKRLDVTAQPASAEELERAWPRLLELYPAWEDYTQRTERSFRAFYLESRG